MQDQETAVEITDQPIQEVVLSTEEQLAVAKDEAEKNRNLWLRSAAELENTRKRFKKESEAARTKGKEDAISGLLTIFDNLERATNATGDSKMIIDGIKIVTSQFGESLKKIGVRRIVTVGDRFDPTIHEAVQQLESDKPIGTVLQELQAGYMIGDYVVRAALVVVAKSL